MTLSTSCQHPVHIVSPHPPYPYQVWTCPHRERGRTNRRLRRRRCGPRLAQPTPLGKCPQPRAFSVFIIATELTKVGYGSARACSGSPPPCCSPTPLCSRNGTGSMISSVLNRVAH